MNNINAAEYSFLGLLNHGTPLHLETCLGYLVGLADSPDHKIVEPLPAKRILVWLSDVEEQSKGGSHLLERQQSFFSRYFPKGYFPQTPVMAAKEWSPISAMLERGFNPVALAREQKAHAVATGIWAPADIKVSATWDIEARRKISEMWNFESCRTVEELFWTIMNETVRRANQRGTLISIIAMPGWNYEMKIDSLPPWSQEDVVSADRILWKCTPEDKTMRSQ